MENFNEQEIVKLYQDGDSIGKLAKKYNTYINKILGILKKSGVIIRSRSQAQKLALENGNNKHPTKGTKRDKATKVKISESNSERWKVKSEEEKKNIKEKARKRWEDMTDEKKDEIKKKANEKIRESAKEGSKLEKYLFVGLTAAGFNAIIHYEWLWNNDKTHLDIFIPNIGFAIEIDGPSHFHPIWGEDVLKKTIKFDNEKRGILLSSGLNVIRVKQSSKFISQKIERDTLSKIIEILRSDRKVDDSYFEIEI